MRTSATALLTISIFSGCADSSRTYESKSGGFSVRFPGKADRVEEVGDATRKTCSMTSGGDYYEVSYYESLTADIKSSEFQGRLERAAILAIGDSRLISLRKIKLGEHPGQEICSESAEGKEERQHLYAANSRLYFVVVRGNKGATTTEKAEEFFSSFKLMN